MHLTTVVSDTVMVTGFVFVMMLVVEFANVASAGLLRQRLRGGGLATLVGAGLLGTAPGCLGSFAAVALYVHEAVPFGALVTTMIATSGDEAFVMLAMFPGRALLLFAILLVYGVLVGWLVDRMGMKGAGFRCRCDRGLEVHDDEPGLGRVLLHPAGLGHWSRRRTALGAILAAFLGSVLAGAVGPAEWNWIRISLVVLAGVALWVVFAVPDHFLDEHLWRHVAREHLPRILLWVGGVLLVMDAVRAAGLPLAELLREHPAVALIAAVLIGIIPESGPHLIFVTLFAQGVVPFSVLAASSAVQDGHGMLPLLAESRREFVRVKAVNVVAGLVLGIAMMAIGT